MDDTEKKTKTLKTLFGSRTGFAMGAGGLGFFGSKSRGMPRVEFTPEVLADLVEQAPVLAKAAAAVEAKHPGFVRGLMNGAMASWCAEQGAALGAKTPPVPVAEDETENEKKDEEPKL